MSGIYHNPEVISVLVKEVTDTDNVELMVVTTQDTHYFQMPYILRFRKA
jgi:hypothetical protein